MRLLVISDIHIGSGPLDDVRCRVEGGLAWFAEGHCGEPGPTTLVINGDFLDFAQAEPWQSKELESRPRTAFRCVSPRSSRWRSSRESSGPSVGLRGG